LREVSRALRSSEGAGTEALPVVETAGFEEDTLVDTGKEEEITSVVEVGRAKGAGSGIGRGGGTG
jgi:uncharacterized protein YuzE